MRTTLTFTVVLARWLHSQLPSWSQDHLTLLAFIRKMYPYRGDDSLPDSDPTTVDARSKTVAKPDRSKKRTDIRLQNFPSLKLTYTMFDLAAKEVLSLGQFEKGLALEVPQQGRHFFLFVGPNANIARDGF